MTGKHLLWSLFFNKVAGLRPVKIKTLAQVLSCQFYEIFGNVFFTERFRTTAFGQKIQLCVANFS